MPKYPTRAVQDYLKAIHRLGGAEKVVSPVEIAERLAVRSPSVKARRVIRRHRLVELFLNRVLGLDWSEVDAEAEALEHAISPRLEQAIAAHLGEPMEDPHGHLIPTREGMMKQRELQRLCDFRADQRIVIREAQDDNPERLRRWRELGLVPGATVEIVRFEPLDNLFEVNVGGNLVRLGPEALAGLRGEPAEEK